ncbi:hypothetical protein EXIGLDRAFT_694518 [Exidia glandulosa HHB12029]|uniref:Uncharacterized protein n=1 Tax=Exidia glandulosa HHB12029 TaxID=1314781 RepID=A0A166MAL1_EXIGL|nr:hypothetical protein EXIGLDRAFT_694518 [Exidia glandulosa HHB12029]
MTGPLAVGRAPDTRARDFEEWRIDAESKYSRSWCWDHARRVVDWRSTWERRREMGRELVRGLAQSRHIADKAPSGSLRISTAASDSFRQRKRYRKHPAVHLATRRPHAKDGSAPLTCAEDPRVPDAALTHAYCPSSSASFGGVVARDIEVAVRLERNSTVMQWLHARLHPNWRPPGSLVQVHLQSKSFLSYENAPYCVRPVQTGQTRSDSVRLSVPDGIVIGLRGSDQSGFPEQA